MIYFAMFHMKHFIEVALGGVRVWAGVGLGLA